METKRIGRSTYMKNGNTIGRITGPWRPGNVWKADVYSATPAFEQAWKDGKVTARERGMGAALDQIVSAITLGMSNDIAPELINGRSKTLGYLYKTKAEAVAAIVAHFAS